MTTDRRERRGARIALWFALLGGAAAWSIHLVSGTFAAELLCVQSAPEGASTFRTAMGVVTLACAAVAAATLVVGLREQARLRRSETPRRRIAGLGAIAATLGAAFTLLIVLEAVPLLMLGCGGA